MAGFGGAWPEIMLQKNAGVTLRFSSHDRRFSFDKTSDSVGGGNHSRGGLGREPTYTCH
jgi:hypothetical protein